MSQKLTTIAPALRALLENFIDYAGIFPPASITLESALANYSDYQTGENSWLLRWLVIDAAELARVPEEMDGRLSVLSEIDQPRAASIESKALVKAKRPVYCEVPVSKLSDLDEVKQSGCLAKIRTGGVNLEAIPAPAQVAGFILACAERRLPFKATAGLHHPIRAEHALTYKADAPRAVMHGFLNVLMASAFAWHGKQQIEAIVSEMDQSAFRFDEKAYWRSESLTGEQIRDTRLNFMHSVGSCSFAEPVQELQELGLI